MLIPLGDFNAKIGLKKTVQSHIGEHSLQKQANGNPQHLTNLAAANNQIVMSTLFPNKNIYKETWVSHQGRTKNQIDHVLANARYSRHVLDAGSKRGAKNTHETTRW